MESLETARRLVAAIGYAEDAEQLRGWLLHGLPSPPVLWPSVGLFGALEAGDTAEVPLEPGELPYEGGDWYFLFHVTTPGDEIEENDVGELFFSTETEAPVEPLPD